MKRDIYYLGAIALLFILCIFVYLRWSRANENNQHKDSVIAEKNAVIQYHVNKEGKIVSEKNAAVLRANEMQKAYPLIVEEIKRDFDIKIKDVKAYVKNTFQAMGTGTGSVINHYHYDSSANKNILDSAAFNTDKDKYLKFNVTYYPQTEKFSPYSYVYTDTARTVFSSTKKWWQFFKTDRIIASTTFCNPNAKVINTTNILVDNYKDKRFSISISIGYGLVKTKDGVNTGWFAGPSISYSLFKF